VGTTHVRYAWHAAEKGVCGGMSAVLRHGLEQMLSMCSRREGGAGCATHCDWSAAGGVWRGVTWRRNGARENAAADAATFLRHILAALPSSRL